MAYELDFIGISEESKDADAIGIRWKTDNDSYVVGVYDGGIKAYGEELKNHINEFYFKDNDQKEVDFVICSHSDLDHTSGIKEILNNFTVKKLYMNRPWIYIDDIFDKVNDGRITKESLKKRLKEKYSYIADLEEIAEEKGILICEAFEGTVINDKLTVLSPSKDFYLELLVESDKTPLEENRLISELNLFESVINLSKSVINLLIESWNDEKLREDVKTSAENEMSVVILGEMEDENFLLTGDAGIRALNNSIEYSKYINKSIIDNVNFYQIPHHGGRHNISPSILNSMVGEIVDEGDSNGKVAYVSAGKNSDHPLQMVVNAFVRRGVRVYKTNGSTIHHQINMPARNGYSSIDSLGFNKNVEEWND